MGLRPRTLRSIELFAGGGGLALGLHRVGVVPVCFVERDLFGASILAARMEEGALPPALIWTDVRTFDGLPFRGRVDLVSGGFPCVDVSNAGKRAGLDGEHSGLWREFARIVGVVRPEFVFFENVSAITFRGLDRVLADLAAMGFDVEWGSFRATEVGAPHRRERVFGLGRRVSDSLGDSLRDESKRGRGPARSPEPRDSESRDGSEDRGELRRMADPRGGRREESEGIRSRESQFERDGEEVGSGREPGGGGIPLDDSRRGRRSIRRKPERARVEGETGDESLGSGEDRRLARSPFPPGPHDVDGWRDFLDRFPDLAPAVDPAQSELRRGSHGVAPGMVAGVRVCLHNRSDRLRVLGNGVVPDVAALAWTVLRSRLGIGDVT